MLTPLVRLGAATSLLAAIVLVVVALGQVLHGAGSSWALTLVLAAGAFGVAWAANRHANSVLAAEHQRLRIAPVPLPVPEGELVLRMRWGKWLLATLCFGAGAGAGVGIFALRAVLVAQHAYGIAVAATVVAVLGPTTLLLLETGRRAFALGGIARLDAHGFRHCLLPAIAWKHVRGVDLDLRIVKDTIKVWTLVLAVDRPVASSIRLAPWWRVLAPGAPSVEDGRLKAPLAYVRGKPHELAGRAISVADRWGAQRIPGWRAGVDPELSARTHAAGLAAEEATRTVERVVRQMRQLATDRTLTAAESGRMMAEAKRSMEEMDRTFEEQMEQIRSGARK